MKINNPNIDIEKQFELQIEKLKEERRILYKEKITELRDSLKQFIENEFFGREIDNIVLDNTLIRFNFINSYIKSFQIRYTRNWSFKDKDDGMLTNPEIEWVRQSEEIVNKIEFYIEIGELSKIIKSKYDKLEIFKEYIIKFNNIDEDPIIKSYSDKIYEKNNELENIKNLVVKNQEQIIFKQGYIEQFADKYISFKYTGDSANKQSRRWKNCNWEDGIKFEFTKNPGKKTFTVIRYYKDFFDNKIKNSILRDNVREEYIWDSIREYLNNKQRFEKKQIEADQNN